MKFQAFPLYEMLLEYHILPKFRCETKLAKDDGVKVCKIVKQILH